MDAEATELTVRACLAEVRIRLDKAAGIARAASESILIFAMEVTSLIVNVGCNHRSPALPQHDSEKEWQKLRE